MSTSVLSMTPSLQPLAMPRRSASVPAIAAVTRHVTSRSLLAGGRELVIQHQGGEYHLRLTRNDKLILTK
jgi:hemin uptake protein HemP